MIRDQQIDRLSEFFVRVAEGLMLGALAIQALVEFDLLTLLASVANALAFLYMSIMVLSFKRRKNERT